MRTRAPLGITTRSQRIGAISDELRTEIFNVDQSKHLGRTLVPIINAAARALALAEDAVGVLESMGQLTPEETGDQPAKTGSGRPVSFFTDFTMPSCTECGAITTTVCLKHGPCHHSAECATSACASPPPPTLEGVGIKDPTKLDMLDALLYISRDRRFHARAKYWEPSITAYFDGDFLRRYPEGPTLSIVPDHLTAEWEIVRAPEVTP